MAANSTASHWNDAYAASETTQSWFQQHPGMSLRMFDAAGVRADASVIGVRAERVSWLVADLRTWEPRRRYAVWHDSRSPGPCCASRPRDAGG